MTLLDFIKRVEGDDSRPLGNGLFGSTWDPYGKTWNLGPGITKGITKTTVMTQAQIDAAVESELSSTVSAVDRLVKVPLNDNRRIVLYSFAYNVGLGAFEKSSVLAYINAGKLDQVPARLSLYVFAGGVKVSGLVNRRNQEIALWNSPDDQPPVPASVPQPKTTPTVQPTISKEIKAMATTASTATATAGTTVSSTSIWASITGIFSGGIVATAAGILSFLAPTLAVTVVGVLMSAGGILAAVAAALALVHLNSATTAATIATIEGLINEGIQDLGGTAQDWDKDGTTNVATA